MKTSKTIVSRKAPAFLGAAAVLLAAVFIGGARRKPSATLFPRLLL